MPGNFDISLCILFKPSISAEHLSCAGANWLVPLVLVAMQPKEDLVPVQTAIMSLSTPASLLQFLPLVTTMLLSPAHSNFPSFAVVTVLDPVVVADDVTDVDCDVVAVDEIVVETDDVPVLDADVVAEDDCDEVADEETVVVAVDDCVVVAEFDCVVVNDDVAVEDNDVVAVVVYVVTWQLIISPST